MTNGCSPHYKSAAAAKKFLAKKQPRAVKPKPPRAGQTQGR